MLIVGEDSENTLDGKAGFDTASFQFIDAGVTVNLTTGAASFGDGSATLSNIERVVGSNFNDTLIGNASNNELVGFRGNDTLNGGDGNDTFFASEGNDTLLGGNGNDVLYGGSGNDSLTGNAGRDQFFYNTNAPFTTASVGVDVINDFSSGIDKIVLDTTTFASISGLSIADGEFRVISSGNGATNAADIIYNSTNGNLYYNPNGSAAGFGSGGQFITLGGSPVLSAGDFIIQA